MTEEYEQVEEEPTVDDAAIDSEYEEEYEEYEEEEVSTDDGIDNKVDWWGEKFAWQ